MFAEKLIEIDVTSLILYINNSKVVKHGHCNTIETIEHERRILNRLKGCSFVLKHFDKELNSEIILENHSNKNLKKMFKSDKHIPVRKIALQIIEGLRHVHSKNVIHYDLNTTNILISTNMDVVIYDFASFSINGYKPSSSSVIETRFCRPRRNSKDYIVQNDLFALRSFLFELCTESSSYSLFKNDNEIAKLYHKGIFPTIDLLMIEKIIVKC